MKDRLAYSYPSPTGIETATLTDAEVVTLQPNVNLKSNVSYSWYLTSTELTGTLAFAVSLQESNQLTGDTDWVEIGTASVSADGTVRIVGVSAYGIRQRLVITGSGTQTATYAVTARFKY